MPGICTSAMTQDVSLSCGEDKNSCAEANAYTENPIDLSNRAVAVRTEGSSSTTEIIGASATRPDLFSRPGPIRAPTASPHTQVRAGTAGRELYLGFEMAGRFMSTRPNWPTLPFYRLVPGRLRPIRRRFEEAIQACTPSRRKECISCSPARANMIMQIGM